MLNRVVKSVLAFKGMTMKDLAEELGENYSSVYDVVHGRWGKHKRKVAARILQKLSDFLDIDIEELEQINNSVDLSFQKKTYKRRGGT